MIEPVELLVCCVVFERTENGGIVYGLLRKSKKEIVWGIKKKVLFVFQSGFKTRLWVI
jgi:hypothetical protein